MRVEVSGHMGEVCKVVESKDGKRIAVASRPNEKYRKRNPKGISDSRQVRVWSLETFECTDVAGEGEWDDMSRSFVGLDVNRDGLNVEARDCARVGMDASCDEVGQESETGFRAVGRGTAFGEGSGEILANFEADIELLEVDHQNKIVAVGLSNDIVASLRIVE